MSNDAINYGQNVGPDGSATEEENEEEESTSGENYHKANQVENPNYGVTAKDAPE